MQMRHVIPIALIALSAQARADPAQIVAVRAEASGERWRFDVTLAHGDTGWDDYADGWAIEDAAGTELGFRLLVHPHVNEQPFSRSLGGVAIPADVKKVFIRPRDLTGFSSDLFEVPLP